MHVLCRYTEKEDTKKLQTKQRERMQPKLGKMDIDYQVRCLFCMQIHQLFLGTLKLCVCSFKRWTWTTR